MRLAGEIGKVGLFEIVFCALEPVNLAAEGASGVGWDGAYVDDGMEAVGGVVVGEMGGVLPKYTANPGLFPVGTGNKGAINGFEHVGLIGADLVHQFTVGPFIIDEQTQGGANAHRFPGCRDGLPLVMAEDVGE